MDEHPQVDTSESEVKGGISYPKLPPRDFASLDAESYIAERFNDAISWYDTKAVGAKSRYQFMRAATVVGGALVPVLVNLGIGNLEIPVRVITTIISIAVVILVSLEGVFHYREQWVNYRSTEQFMRKEYFLFTAREGSYVDKEAKEAYTLFVERIENAIAGENASTLQIMTRVSDVSKQSSSGGP
jgi:hypothetical protein